MISERRVGETMSVTELAMVRHCYRIHGTNPGAANEHRPARSPVTAFRAGLPGVGFGFQPSSPFRAQPARQPRRPLFVPGSAEARGSVKAARFRTAFVQLRACGVLRTACDSPAFPPRP